MKRRNLIYLPFLAVGATVISGLSSNTYAATSAIDEITITVPSSCSLSNTVGTNHSATIETGIYQDDIGETTFQVFCNDAEGFAVYTVGYTNDEFGNNTLRPSTIATSNAIATGTATSGSTSNWAMKLTAVTGDNAPTLETGFDDYHVIPNSYTKVASYASATSGGSGSSFKSTYGAFISGTQPADTYSGKIKYTIIHPANGDAPTLSINDLTYLQDFDTLSSANKTAILASMADSTTYNLVDNRDNKTYKVAKMKDGKVWMAENLDLGRTTLTNDLTSANTNLTTTITASTFNGWIKTAGTNSYTSAELIPVTGTDATSTTPYGTLYNYCATSAGTVCTSTSDSDASADLCPAGWRLPTGGSNGEFQALYNVTEYHSAANLRAPITSGGAGFALPGYFDSTTPKDQGTTGFYWSSTRKSNTSVYLLYLETSYADPASDDIRVGGNPIRCVAK